MKFLKWFFAIIAVIALLFYFIAMPYLREETKKNSPQKTAVYTKNGMDLQVSYSSPYKKGRVIFGELVPFDQVWRTGANEPTVLVNGSTVSIMGQDLPAGTYSVWTIPGREKWDIIFNEEVPDWGVTLLSGGKKTSRNPESDVLKIERPVINLIEEVESFTISFEETGALYLCMDWDKTKIRIPITK